MGLWSKTVGKVTSGGKKIVSAGKKIKKGIDKGIDKMEDVGDKIKSATNTVVDNPIAGTAIDAAGAAFGIPDATGKIKRTAAAFEDTTDGIKKGKDALNGAMSKAQYVNKISNIVPKDFKESYKDFVKEAENMYSTYTRNWQLDEMPKNLLKYDFRKIWSK